jgi:hypothetical protein
MNNLLRVQVKNKGNSTLIAKLKTCGTLIKRSGDSNSQARYNCNQGLATFDIDKKHLHLVPNDSYVLNGNGRVSAKKYKAEREQ